MSPRSQNESTRTRRNGSSRSLPSRTTRRVPSCSQMKTRPSGAAAIAVAPLRPSTTTSSTIPGRHSTAPAGRGANERAKMMMPMMMSTRHSIAAYNGIPGRAIERSHPMGESESRERMEEGGLSRREFLDGRKVVAGAALVGLLPIPGLAQSPPADPPAAKAPPGPLPRRKLGRTGVEVSVLGLGTATMGEGPQDVEECASVFAEAIDRGISYVDTARIYGDAETALGRVLKTRRDKIFLATKSMTDTREEAQKSFEQSLRELGVDHVD